MKFLCLGKSIDEASTRYRLQPLMQRLAESHEVQFQSTEMKLPAKLKLLLTARQFDTVIIQRKLFAPWFIRALKKRVRRLVFDFDDAIFVSSSGKSSSSRMSKFKALCQVVDIVFAGNDYLAAAAVDAGVASDRVYFTPTSVETRRYVLKDVIPEINPTLVWIGSSSTRRYLDFLTPALERLGGQIPNLQLKVISDFEFHLDGMNVINIPWSETAEVRELASSHIGIAPMIDDPWTRGKCALKVLQYMAARLPVVSSRCGANSQVIVEGETGFLAESEEEWCHAIEQLVNDPALKLSMGTAGRERVVEKFGRTAVITRALEALAAT